MTQDLIWKSLKIDPSELVISKVLRCGQSFRWKHIDGIWSCTLNNRIILLRQDEQHLHYSSLPTKTMLISPQDSKDKSTESIIKDYFNLDISIGKLYSHWSSRDKNFLKNAKHFTGIRMLRQDPWENLVSFICSTNNNVKRISKMVENLCINYGEFVGTFQDIDHYSFPPPQSLSPLKVENELRNLGFGYRAKYIQATSQMLADEKELEKLYSMRNPDLSSQEVHEYLLQFKGVGPKVADCVALMSLDRTEVVPVDTHVFQFAIRDYKFRSGGKSAKQLRLTKDIYSDIQEFFVELWGDYAGWAHSVLFAADLKDLENGINITNTIEVKTESQQQLLNGTAVETETKITIKRELDDNDSQDSSTIVVKRARIVARK